MHNNSNHNELENQKMKKNVFQVPEGYFDQLHEGIIAQSELTILVDKNLKENIFKTPEGYFDQLHEGIIAQSELTILVDKNLKENIFKTPEGYFDQLHEGIIAQSELTILADKNLKENIFKTPEGYFDSAFKLINEQFEEDTKVIPLYNRNWMRYAAAVAVLIVAFIFGIKSNDDASNYEYANLSDEVIIEYLLDEEISNLDILASIDNGINILDELYEDEMSALEFPDYDNPEMEYDFEYTEY